MTKLPTGRHTQTIKSAKKNKQRELKNKSLRSRVKTYVRKVNETADAGILPEASKYIDMAANKGAIHKNKAARLKSRIAAKINSAKTEK
jgi:small subunit ribosomal protein S20